MWMVSVRNHVSQPAAHPSPSNGSAALVKRGHYATIRCRSEGVITLTSEADFRPHASFVYVAGSAELVATTDAVGTARFAHVPDGTWDVRVWHELGVWSGSVTVGGANATVEATLERARGC